MWINWIEIDERLFFPDQKIDNTESDVKADEEKYSEKSNRSDKITMKRMPFFAIEFFNLQLMKVEKRTFVIRNDTRMQSMVRITAQHFGPVDTYEEILQNYDPGKSLFE